MLPYMNEHLRQPQRHPCLRAQGRAGIEQARRMVAKLLLNCAPGEIVFTSCGTEADNMAVGVQRARPGREAHHHLAASSTTPWNMWPKRWSAPRKPRYTGCACMPDGQGRPRASGGVAEGTHNVLLVADARQQRTGHAQRPVGHRRSLPHATARSSTRTPCRPWATTASTWSSCPSTSSPAAAHKFHGPKGVGFLYMRKGSVLKPLIVGGSQERNMRAGTENITALWRWPRPWKWPTAIWTSTSTTSSG
jgi:cysteine desulfurase